jgi:hypothetical protein
MPNPATFLSASTGLSGLTGGTVPAGASTGAASGSGNQITDFSSVLSGHMDFTAARTPGAKFSAAAPADSIDTPEPDDSANDDATASGKALPLAALIAAVLPVPVTLSALVDKPKSMDDTPAPDGTIGKTASPTTACTPDVATQSATLLAMAQTATPITTPVPVTKAAHQPRSGNVPAASAPGRLAQALPPLPRPGFTLLPDAGAADQEAGMMATNLVDAATVATPATAITPGMTTGTDKGATVTLSAGVAMAMAQPARPGTTQAGYGQAGFALLTPGVADGASGDASASHAPALAAGSAAIKPDTTVTLTDAAYLPAISARPGFTLIAGAAGNAAKAKDTGNGVTAPLQLAQAGAVPPAPGFAGQSFTGQSGTDQGPVDPPAPKGRLASARGDAPQGTSAQATAGLPARSSARDASENADAFPSHSPVSQSADGAGALDNAPTSIQSLASASTTANAQTLAASGGAATPTPPLASANAAPQNGTDMAALVDRLVEARAAARSGLGAQSTMASIAHADFGRVSLRFDQDDAGMSISMTSRDPGFAPAAQAALAQSPAVAAGAQGHGAGQSGSGQNSGQQPGQQWAQSGAQSGFQGGAASNGQGQAGAGNQGWAQGGQNGAPQHQRNPVLQAQATTSASTSTGDAGARRRGGILA